MTNARFHVSLMSIVLAGLGMCGLAQAQGIPAQAPIRVPDGTHGMQPNLALIYSQNAGNSLLGMGWKLAGLSAITRINYGNGINLGSENDSCHISVSPSLLHSGLDHVAAREHTDDARDLPTASSPPERSPCALPFSDTAPTPDPLSPPPRGEGHLHGSSPGHTYNRSRLIGVDPHDVLNQSTQDWYSEVQPTCGALAPLVAWRPGAAWPPRQSLDPMASALRRSRPSRTRTDRVGANFQWSIYPELTPYTSLFTSG
jgi:hypothetical protein